MARKEQEREDLLAEATALVERIELIVDGVADHVVIGFRRDGCASLYFGDDPAFHFNTRGELRRAFVRGVLYKAERRRLVALTRRRTEREVQLLRHEFDDLAQNELVAQCEQRLACLRERLKAGTFTTVGQVPAASDIAARTAAFLDNLSSPPHVALSPHAR